MSIVILGAGGQLGRELRRVLPSTLALDRAGADLTQPLPLRQTLESIRPRIVINAAGYTQVERAEAEPAAAFAVNALGVRDLALICHRDLNATLVHFSTDYVFGLDALRDSPYDEADAPAPCNVYGASKLAGEHFVRGLCPKHFILRTCGVYGAAGSGRPNFVETMLRKADEGASLRVVNDQICTPTAGADLAQAVVELLDSQAYGLYHLTNGGACSWHEFAQAIFASVGRAVDVTPIRSTAYAAAAKRPAFSVLSNRRWLNGGFTPLRPWRAALEQYLAERGRF